MNLALIQNFSRNLGRSSLQFKKNSPHIFFAAGVAGSITSTVMACKATLNLSDTLTQIEGDIANVKLANSKNEQHPEASTDLVAQSLLRAYLRSGVRLARLYGPSAGVAVVSYSLLSGSHIQLTRRNAALAAAYGALAKAYEEYRQRVISEIGEDKELEIYHGIGCLEDDEAEEGPSMAHGLSGYARLMDEVNPNFIKNVEYMDAFIRCQQNYANDRLRAKGHVFLNEVYEWLGFEHTTAGAVVGWVLDGDGDGYIDFGLYEDGKLRDMSEPRVWLDFNVDGVVYDRI
jgi:hypothetical protein